MKRQSMIVTKANTGLKCLGLRIVMSGIFTTDRYRVPISPSFSIYSAWYSLRDEKRIRLEAHNYVRTKCIAQSLLNLLRLRVTQPSTTENQTNRLVRTNKTLLLRSRYQSRLQLRSLSTTKRLSYFGTPVLVSCVHGPWHD